tara:strand:+ start:222 stop:377 length:156 start_codon:yes stop_codon:yes gene_type:complete
MVLTVDLVEAVLTIHQELVVLHQEDQEILPLPLPHKEMMVDKVDIMDQLTV